MSQNNNSRSSRRRFLQGAACTGLAAGLTSFDHFGTLANLARASEVNPGGKPDRYYVFAYFSGGWDVLLSLDPRNPVQFHNGNMLLTKIQPGYEYLNDPTNDGSPVTTSSGLTFGPYMGELLKHVDKMTVLRGMSMDTLTHEVGRRRFLTGKSPTGLLARGSSAATWLASELGVEQPIPNLSVRVESYNVDQPNYATGLKVASVPDLVRALKAADPTMDTKLDMLVDQMLVQQGQCDVAQHSPTWLKAEQSRNKAREMVTNGFDSLFDFQANTLAMETLRDHYKIAATGTAALQTPQAQAAMAATALKAGISRCVSFQAASGLDTHYDEWERDQGPTQADGFSAVSRLVDDLSSTPYYDTGESWMDHTVIIGFSEFSRTPLLNSRGGRDHHLTNSCFVMGAGIRGNHVVGASSDIGMTPTAVDLATGLSDPGGEVVRPEHLIQALFHDIDVYGDPADLRVDPLTAILKTS